MKDDYKKSLNTHEKMDVEYVERTEKCGGPAESLARELLREHKDTVNVNVSVRHQYDTSIIFGTLFNGIAIILLWIKVLMLG